MREKTNCMNCGTLVLYYPSKPRKFCSYECDKDFKKTPLQTCMRCGKDFKTYKKGQPHCSKSCAGVSRVVPKITGLPPYTSNGSISEIQFSSCPETFIVDGEIADLVSKYKWHKSDTGYAVRRDVIGAKKVTIRLHRLVAGAREGEIVDHINRNKLDNRRANLRITTQKVNTRNSDRYDNAKGYYYSAKRDRWIVDSDRIGIRHRQFKTEREAIDLVEEAGTISRRGKAVDKASKQ